MNHQNEFLECAKDLFLKPQIFFKKYFDQYNDRPFFGAAFFIFSVGYGINRLDASQKRYSFTDNWIGYWTIAVFGGLLGGFLIYLVGGWFYNVRVKWSEGTPDLETSRNLFLYSGVVSGAASIACAIVAFILQDGPNETVSISYGIITILFLMFFNLYSVFVSFCGVTEITDVNYNKARFWFLIIPMLLYSLSYFAALRLYFNYFSK